MSDQRSAVPNGRRVRGVVVDVRRRAFLGIVNNRVAPGRQTIMLPGGLVGDAESPFAALERHMRDELGVTPTLDSTNTRFLLSRSYEFDSEARAGADPRDAMTVGYIDPASGRPLSRGEIFFYAIDIDGLVARNMRPEEVVSVSWMTLGDVERWMETDQNWRTQLGAVDAVRAALDPARARFVEGGRETSRREGGPDPLAGGRTAPAALPYGPTAAGPTA
jgi:hypothetical protein